MTLFTPFKQSIEGIELPERFNFPFAYIPHPLCKVAAIELQEYLATQNDWQHNFGDLTQPVAGAIGKMFGVMIVKKPNGEIGYISAFSGKLANSNHHNGFVPPVFDILTEEGFFKKEEIEIHKITLEIDRLEGQNHLIDLKEQIVQLEKTLVQELQEFKQLIKKNKTLRQEERNRLNLSINATNVENVLEALRKQSVAEQFALKTLKRKQEEALNNAKAQLDEELEKIHMLKLTRKNHSNDLQRRLHESYTFLNAKGESASLLNIFKNTALHHPPAGAGECAAPKLLQYAYLHQLEPIAFAEFWWGQSPASEVRRHGHFYPSCKGKCEPILGHMLKGLNVDPNPMLENPAEGKTLDFLYEDDDIVVVNKPAEFLSVPGININDSVQERIRFLYPHATGPLIVHRLDMSTSGIMVLAKNERAYKILQRQFIKRKVVKRYLALLEGEVKTPEGEISLPLRVDLEDRPRQLVCYEHGKHAHTDFKVLKVENNRTLIHFFPQTGRTHQLRVHAAHVLGLNAPIVGDDLYGQVADRLHLHAEFLQIEHPTSRELMRFEVPAPFSL